LPLRALPPQELKRSLAQQQAVSPRLQELAPVLQRQAPASRQQQVPPMSLPEPPWQSCQAP
jgi:hypothetical protein